MEARTSGTVTTRDGRTLGYIAVGEGEPTVVFESGMGSSGRAWGVVQREVGRRVRAVTYDRAGFGASSPDPAGRQLARQASDLVDVLEHLGGAPVVLVGHSWGGPIVRTVAAQRPDLVAGLVLVDQTDESCDLYFDPRVIQNQQRMARLLPRMARFGLVRLGLRWIARDFPRDLRKEVLKIDGSVAGTLAMQAELATLEDDLAKLRANPPVLPPVPVTWISGTKTGAMGGKTREALVAGHRASAAAHPGGRHVDAATSGHYVMWSQPELVVAEILRVVEGLQA